MHHSSPWVGRCVFTEGEFAPMPPLTRLARFRARARRCARSSAPETRPNCGKWTSKMNPARSNCPRAILTQVKKPDLLIRLKRADLTSDTPQCRRGKLFVADADHPPCRMWLQTRPGHETCGMKSAWNEVAFGELSIRSSLWPHIKSDAGKAGAKTALRISPAPNTDRNTRIIFVGRFRIQLHCLYSGTSPIALQ